MGLLEPGDIKGAWSIVPTPAKPGASDWRATDTVDLDEAARVVDGLVKAGLNGIMSMGSLGECATLTWEEKKAFMATLVAAARGRVPVFVGTTALNTRDTVEQTFGERRQLFLTEQGYAYRIEISDDPVVDA